MYGNNNQNPGYQPLNNQPGREMQNMNYGGNNVQAQVNANNQQILNLQFQPYLNQPRIKSNFSHPASNGGQFGAIIEAVEGVFIKEKTDWLEAVGGCESKNSYRVKAIGNDNGPDLFKAKEDSGCLNRNCIAPALRPFNMYITNMYTQENAIMMEREYSLPIFCLFRPVIKVFEMLKGLKNHPVGHIIDEYNCCAFNFDVYDHTNKWVFRMSTEWCQRGIQCKLPCDSCKEVEFIITEPTGREVTRAKREGRGLVKNFATDSDQFRLMFPRDMPWNYRTLLMSAVLFADFRLFEMSSQQKQQGSGF